MVAIRRSKFSCFGVSAFACSAALALSARPVRASETKVTCTAATAAYKSALESEKAGHYRDARASLAECMEATVCSVVNKCGALADKITDNMPTIVAVVTDPTGEPKCDVQVTIDGETLSSHLDGRALPVEPGLHEFTFSADGGVLATEKVMILEGERNRRIAVSLKTSGAATMTTGDTAGPSVNAPDEAPGPANASERAASNRSASSDSVSARRPPEKEWAMPRSAFPYVLGGLGLAGVAAGGLLTYWGSQDNAQLQTTCKPQCDASSVDHIRTMYLASDIALGAGAVALAVTTWMIASSRVEKSPAPAIATVVDVHPIASGAFASVSGAF